MNGSPLGMGSGGNLSYLNITVVLEPGAYPVNFDRVNVNYTVNEASDGVDSIDPLEKRSDMTRIPPPGSWAICQKSNNKGTADNILDQDEQFIICITPTMPIRPNQTFYIEFIPPKGLPFPIKRTAPPTITDSIYELTLIRG